MALLGTLVARLEADTSDFTQGLKKAEGNLKSAGQSMQKAGRNMSLKVTAPLAGIAGMALKIGADFEKSMNQVSAVSGATGAQLSELEKVARDMGATTRFSATEAAEGMNFLAMAGFDVKETISALPATLDLASAGNMELAESADIVSNVMQGFGKEASMTQETVDVLTKAFTSSNTSLTQLGEAMSYVAPVAKAFGQEINETTAAVGILSDAGIQGSRAGTGLRQSLMQLSKQSEKLGVSVRDANGSMLPMVEILENIEDAGLTTEEVISAVGSRAGTAMAALMDRGSEALRDFTTELDNAGGSAKDVAETQMQGLSGAMIELRSALSEVAISFSGEFQGSVESLVDSLTGFARWLGELDSGTKKFILTIAGLAAAIGPVLLVSGMMVQQTGNLVRGFRAANSTMKLVIERYGAMKLAMGGVAIAVAALVAGFIKHKIAVNNFNDAQKELASAASTAKKNMVNERLEVERLIGTIEDETTSRKAKKEAYDELQKMAPDHFGNLKIEAGLLDTLKERQKEFNDELIRGARIEAFKDKIVELNKELLDLQEEGTDVSAWNALEGTFNHVITGGVNPLGAAMEAGEVAMEEYNTKVTNTQEAIERLEKALRDTGETTTETTSAFEEETLRRQSELSVDLTGNLRQLKAGLSDVEAAMLQVQAEGNPIPPKLKAAAEAYRAKIEEVAAAQDMSNIATENATVTYSELESGLSEVEGRIQDVLAAGNPVPQSLIEQANQYKIQLERINAEMENLYQQPSIKSPISEMDSLSMSGFGEEPLPGPTIAGAEMEGNMFPTPSPEDIEIIDAFQERWRGASEAISNAIGSAAVDVAANSAEMIGSMAAGTASMQDLGNMIFGTLADLAIRVGKIAIGTAIAIEGIKKALSSLNPVLAAAAGIALIALGSFVKGRLAKSAENSGDGAGSDLQGLATGGQVIRPGEFLVGEEGPEKVTLPRGAAVTPNHAIGSNKVGDYKEELVTRLRGRQIDIVLQRWHKDKARI